MTGYPGAANLEAMTHAANYNAFLLSLVLAHAKPSDTIVDFGAGLGTFARTLAQRGFRVSCVEPDPAQARKIAATGLEVVPRLAQLEEASVDFVYALNVLEHIRDDRSALRECRGRLRIGGRVLAYVPALHALYSSMDENVGHYRRYTRRELCQRITSAGLQVVESSYADFLGVPVTLAFKAIGSRDGNLRAGPVRIYDRYVFPASLVCDRVFGKLAGKNAYALAVRRS